jgi:riboflavin synthase
MNDTMFTGIIEAAGSILSSRPTPGGRRLSIDAGPVAADAQLGASIAINGVCLTVAAVAGARLEFDVIAETLRRTNLGQLQPGHKVNLERALRPSSRLDGHFVQGHVDGAATVTRRLASEKEWVLWFRADDAVRAFLIPKGSVAIDGVSLTIATVEGDEFSVAIIPTTLRVTTLADRQVGDRVNIESDIIARTVIHHLGRVSASDGLTMDTLREHGFL